MIFNSAICLAIVTMCLAVKGYVEFTAERVKGIVAIVVEFGGEESEDWPVVTSINIAIYTHVSQLGMLEEWLEQLNGNQSSQLLYQNLCNFVYPPYAVCVLEDTLKGTGPCYKLSMPGEAKDLMHNNEKMSWIRKL